MGEIDLNVVINFGLLVVGGLAAYSASQSARSAKAAQQRANEIHNSEKLLAQRQFIVPLWQQTSTLAEIDPDNPKTDDVVRALNVLELVAVCTEAGMVDPQVMKRVFADNFMRLYRQIVKCRKVPRLNEDGVELLTKVPAVKQLFAELEAEANAKHKPTQMP